MGNAFLLYMPPGNAEAMVHYQDTVKNRVSLSRISRFVSGNLNASLIKTFGQSPIAVWGSQAGPRNRGNYERMSPGDDIVIVEGDTVRLIGKVAAKVENEALARELWKPIGRKSAPWQLIYFIANPRELDVPFAEFRNLFGYEKTYRLQGFTSVAQARLEEFYARYDDLYSVLVKLQGGEAIAMKTPGAEIELPSAAPELVEIGAEEIDEVVNAEAISDHVRMQWKLARLGLKAGERVWVPVGDQKKLEQAYKFSSFDPEFSSGIDLPHSYVENIDVVWKQEFRIGAAYEIENSTSIFSGLLRFADLNILAPNTLYPMFVVAPNSRKNSLRQQLLRPTFKRLELNKKVRFLSYEAIDEIDTFFANSTSGLNVETIVGRSEQVA